VANLQQYSLIFVTVNGRLLSEEGSVTISRDSKAQEVDTMAKGFAGVSQGASMVSIDVTNAVPAADFEFDAGRNISSLDVVEIGALVAGKQGISKGFIVSDSIKSSVNSPTSYDFKFIGQPFQYE
jgi:hypothetical protein